MIHWPADAFIDWIGHQHVAPGDGLRLLGDAAVKDCDDNKDRGKLGNRAQSLAKREEGFGAVSCLVIGLHLAPLWMTKSALLCPRFVFVLPALSPSLLPVPRHGYSPTCLVPQSS